MAKTKAQQRATAKYEAKAYDKTIIRMPKGRLDEVRGHAAARGESLNGFINRAINTQVERDNEAQTAHSGPGAAPD